ERPQTGRNAGQRRPQREELPLRRDLAHGERDDPGTTGCRGRAPGRYASAQGEDHPRGFGDERDFGVGRAVIRQSAFHYRGKCSSFGAWPTTFSFATRPRT